MAVILLFSFPPAETFDYDALRRTVHNFKKHFSVRLLLDPHIPRFFCLSAGLATAHQDHRFLPLLLRPSCSRLCEGGRCAVTYHQHERGFVYFPRFLGLTCCLSPSTSKLSPPQSEGSLVFIVKHFGFTYFIKVIRSSILNLDQLLCHVVTSPTLAHSLAIFQLLRQLNSSSILANSP